MDNSNNFFQSKELVNENNLNIENELLFVDVPGYGYAQAPESQVKQWQQVIFAYLQGRVNLKRVFLLIDSRHGIKKVDKDIMEMLDNSTERQREYCMRLLKLFLAACK